MRHHKKIHIDFCLYTAMQKYLTGTFHLPLTNSINCRQAMRGATLTTCLFDPLQISAQRITYVLLGACTLVLGPTLHTSPLVRKLAA